MKNDKSTRRRKVSPQAWVIIWLALFFALSAFAIAALIAFRALRAGHGSNAAVEAANVRRLVAVVAHARIIPGLENGPGRIGDVQDGATVPGKLHFYRLPEEPHKIPLRI